MGAAVPDPPCYAAAMSIHGRMRAQLLERLQSVSADEAEPAALNEALRMLAKYRSALIQTAIVRECGTKVQGGPFAGMIFVERSAEGCHVPKLLGCYEEELHDVLLAIPSAGYATVLNIGCAEGYYAVGIKRLLPDARVLAFDIAVAAQAACRQLAAKNKVDLEVGGEFKPPDFARFAQTADKSGRVLVWCDIEGAEIELLDPARAPALREMDLVVELHPTRRGHAADIVPPRFAATHRIEIRHARGHLPELPPFLSRLGHLDQLLAQWEWRSVPTPWAVMRANC